MRLVYSPEAIADLVRLRRFIAEHDPRAASRIASELLARIDNLCAFPGMGRSVAAAPQPDTLRDFSFGRYLVRYALHGQTLVVLRLWHHHEDRADEA